ncbi:RNB domain-containing ribonuclease [Gordonia phosphorivorans]|uniref:RNB domain-containing ribonuclease n=1 Tax=Gordonia phosphorivorans TaxID=1056982 RepID=A0ABV6H4S6_9ACTN
MVDRRVFAPGIDFGKLRAELGLVAEFGSEVEAAAATAVDRYADARIDRSDLELVTVDPPGSMDLDQALRVVADDDGYLVHYAIADVAALVEPGGVVDEESRRRGATIYFPDGNVPLHPRVLSEGAGSLLPEVDRPAVLWTVRVAADGEVADVACARATVRSRARLDYAGVTADAAAGRLHPALSALPDFAAARQSWSLARGAVMLDLPDQDVIANDNPEHPRAWTLRLAPHTPADGWNAQVSLLVGLCAGALMRQAGIGFFRTLPAAEPAAVDELRRIAATLDAQWPHGATPGQFLATLAPDAPSTLALMSAGARLMRGAGYRAIGAEGADSAESVTDAELVHAGVGGLYAHVTAPLRRFADRYATEICLAVTAGRPVDEWVLAALPGLGKVMSGADAVANTAARNSVNLTEAVVLADQVGARFSATVLRDAAGRRPAEIFVAEPAVIAPCTPAPAAGQRCVVEVTEADPVAGVVAFAAVGDAADA